MPQHREYDGIVIGAGHNGLILEGYLARAGLEVVAAERHLEVGGGLDAHENPERPGFWHNAHSVNHRGLVGLPWFRDLEMARWGSEYIQPDPWYTLILSDGRALVWWKDPEQTAASIRRFSERDARAFLDCNKAFAKVAQQIMAPETYHPPLPAERKRELLENTEAGREYFKWARLSLLEATRELFTDSAVQAFVLYIMLIRGSEIDQPGLGYQIPGVIAAGISASLAKGTSHRTAQVLNKAVVAAGGDVVEARPVTKIIVENGRAVGVKLIDGSELRARRFVASSLNPQQTFLELVGEEHLEGGFAERVRNFKYSTSTPILSLHLALNEPPDYIAAKYDEIVNRTWLVGLGVDTLDDIERACQQSARGQIPDAVSLLGATPTIFDPTQAPPGKHTSFMWYAPCPYDLADGGAAHWDDIQAEQTQRALKAWQRYAPNLSGGNILSLLSNTPLDVERHYPNMAHGDWMCGALTADQFLDKRPLPELSQYRTPIEGLYLCGSCCHPGGNITGAPGYNAAGVIARDLGIERWWNPHDLEQVWSAIPRLESASA